jgi:phosphomannomutase
MEIHFGTDGWRALIADTYTFDNVKKVAQAAAHFWKSEKRRKLSCYSWKPGTYACTYRPPEKGIVIGYDARFLSDQFARTAAEVFASNEIPVFLSKCIAPTPTVSFAIADQKLSGGIMITASHNPYNWNGFKIKMEFAGSALPEITQGVEQEIKKVSREKSAAAVEKSDAMIEMIDVIGPYFNAIKQKVDLALIEKNNFEILVDPLYGTNVGLMKKLLPKARIEEIHSEKNPLFGGLNPEPIDVNLRELMHDVPFKKASVGLAFDGDGDRIGAVDENGRFLSSHEIFCLLLWHLAKNRQWKGAVAKTFSTTNRLKLLSDHFCLPFYETPVGFKHICKLFLTQDVLIGGEESGGIGMKNHIPERDSMLNALMLLELMSTEGKKLGEILNDIHQTIGFFHTDRIDLHLAIESKEAVLSSLTQNVPDKINGFKLEGVSNLDGVKYLLEKNAWILFRASGTEPLIRIYAEAEGKEKVTGLLEKAKELVEHGQPVSQAKN